MPRWTSLAAALVSLSAASMPNAYGQSRATDLGPSRRATQVAPIVNEALGLAHSRMSMVAVERTGEGDVLAHVLLDGEPRTLELHPHSIRSANYQLLVQQADGTLQAAAPGPIKTFRGKVAGIADSAVAASLDDAGLRAIVLIPGRERMWIEPVPSAIAGDADTHVVYTDADRLHEGPPCGTVAGPEAAAHIVNEVGEGDSVVATSSFGANDTRWAQLAVDSDVQFYDRYGSVEGVEAVIHEIINITNIQYERDVGIGHYVVALVVRPSEPDPYTSSQADGLLHQFQDHWFRFHADTERDVAHFFTARPLANGLAGLAYISGICDDVEGYSLVTRGTTFCGTLACHTDLTAHELGHNWAAFHCSCTGWTMNASIQSSNRFHPDFTIPDIVSYRNTRTCLEIGDTLLDVLVETPAPTMAENNEVPLSAFADFEFAYDQDVTSLVTWSVDPPALGTVSPDGVFTTNEVAGAVNGTLNATYTFGSVTKIGSTPITVIDAQPAPLPDFTMPAKVRYVSVSPPAAGGNVALQLRIVSLHVPDPPDLSPGPDYSGWGGAPSIGLRRRRIAPTPARWASLPARSWIARRITWPTGGRR